MISYKNILFLKVGCFPCYIQTKPRFRETPLIRPPYWLNLVALTCHTLSYRKTDFKYKIMAQKTQFSTDDDDDDDDRDGNNGREGNSSEYNDCEYHLVQKFQKHPRDAIGELEYTNLNSISFCSASPWC